MGSRPTRTPVEPFNTRPSNEEQSSITEQFLSIEERQEFRRHNDLGFENLALEGGGSVGIAHIGAIKVLEELGYLEKIKRFAGTSAGALVATMLALGHNSSEIEKVIQRDFKPIIKDGGCCVPCNLLRRYGAHPGRELEQFIADTIKDKTCDKDYTFKQLYEKMNVELCILATDLIKMDVVYFHVKTTPDMPIYLAARASSSLPVLLEPVKWKNGIFVDGGVLCNYPVHAYDGWYLSMEEEDQFLTRFSDLANMDERLLPAKWFGSVNEKTLGVMLYSDSDQVFMKEHMEKRTRRYTQGEVIRPNTELSRASAEQTVENSATEVEKMKSALGRLLTMLDRADLDSSGTVSRQNFRDVWNESVLTPEDTELLFGTVQSTNYADEIFDKIDTQQNGNIEQNEVNSVIEQRVNSAQTAQGNESRNIGGIKEFITALIQTVMLHAKRATAKSSDCSRTIGINTGYLGTFDWSMEQDDRDFLIKRGKQAALCFLREYKENSSQCVVSGEVEVPHTPRLPTIHREHTLPNQPITNQPITNQPITNQPITNQPITN